MSFKIPAGLLDQHMIALGKTGSGKSSKLRVFVEHLLDKEKDPVCILDVKGDWWGLKSSADGKKSGYPLVIFGGKHADVPLNPRAGREVAELIFTGNRSCIIDIRAFTQGERSRFFIDLASTGFRVTQGKRYLVIAEVHNFAPKGKILSPQAGEMLHWANRLASEGRGLGLTLLADSQRGQKVHNDFLTSCETLIGCKVIHKADRDAIKDWVDGCADPTMGKQVIESLAQLKKPQAWVWCPEIEYGPQLTEFPLFKTYDSFKPQQANHAKLKGWADVDLGEVKSRLAAVVAEAVANDPTELKARIAKLERELKAKPSPAPVMAAPKDPKALEKARAAAKANAAMAKQLRTILGEFMKFIVRIEAEGFKSAEATATIKEALDQAVASAMQKIEVATDRRTKAVTELREQAAALMAKAEKIVAGEIVEIEVQVQRNQPFTVTPTKVPHAPGKNQVKTRELPVAKVPHEMNGEAKLSVSARKVLSVLSQFPEGCERGKLTLLTGYAWSGSFQNTLGALRTAGLIEGDNGSFMRITDAGLAYGPFPELPQGDALVSYWINNPMFGKAARQTLELLSDGRERTKEELCEETGYEWSGSFQNALGQLRTAGVMVGKNSEKMRISPEIVP